MWKTVIERFERYAPASVMARLALEHALPAHWTNEVFETHRQRQYPRELLFSTVVELMTLVSLGLRPSLHAAARKLDERQPESLAALYDKVNRCEPPVLRALVLGSGQRLASVAACRPGQACVPGWQLRVLDGNHLPASDKRLAVLRGFPAFVAVTDIAWGVALGALVTTVATVLLRRFGVLATDGRR